VIRKILEWVPRELISIRSWTITIMVEFDQGAIPEFEPGEPGSFHAVMTSPHCGVINLAI